ncbi:MAG: alpha/beta fold hydrolase [Enhydrobacter sp.]|nr:MAG: alpha/beta fold hydrolase [Enhydrobacter sp.]
MNRVFFLPGAGGSPDFWKPVAGRLPADWSQKHFGWPGLGHQPHDPSICSMDDLVDMVGRHVDGPVDLVAQSMGGIVAMRLALAHPGRVRRLVLCVTSGGIDMGGFGVSDWRPAYRQSYPNAVDWITAERSAAALPVEQVTAPTLLIWGDADPISPLAVGRHLQGCMPNAHLHVVAGGDHDLAVTHAEQVASRIIAHLA